MNIEKEARKWIEDNYPLMNANNFNDCDELDVHDMISFAQHIKEKLEQSPERVRVDTIVNWPSVDEKLPPLDEIVWLHDGKMTWIGGRSMVDSEYWLFGNTYGNIWHNGKKWDGDLELDDDYQPKFWKPLPEPPQAN